MTNEIVQTKIGLLSKSAWSYRDIMQYFKVSAPTATNLKNRAIETYDGTVPYGSNFATTESILKLFGTSRQREIDLLNKMILEAERPIQKTIIDFDFDVGEDYEKKRIKLY